LTPANDGSSGACSSASGHISAAHSSPFAPELAQQTHVPRNSITSRDEVRRALEELCEYYRVHEPASPLPLLLRRCQRLVGLDFLTTLRELAPEALATLTWLSGSSHESARSS
jgi:type VI secretion system protein ImpA